MFFNRNIIFKITSNIAPGKPSNPTIIDVNKFSPIWNPKLAPIILIIYIHNPPKIELIINLKMFLSGQINIFPNINMNIIHAKKVITELKSKLITSI